MISLPNPTRRMMFTNRQLEIIADAVEDYAMLVNEDLADECGEILDIIDAHQRNNEYGTPS